MKRHHRFISSVLVFCTMCSVLPLQLFAEEVTSESISMMSSLLAETGELVEGKTSASVAEESVTLEVWEETVPEVNLPDSAELFAGFAERELYGYETATFGTTARAGLNVAEQNIYDALKARIEEVALNGGSSVFFVDHVSDLKTTWTNTEMGVSSITNLSPVKAAFNEQFSLNNILNALLNDCPFDLYWFDKTQGVAMGYKVSSNGYSATIFDIKFTFAVSENYRTGDNTVTYDVGKVTIARETAAQVVAVNGAKTAANKLKAYKEYICNAVSYNYAAVNNNSTPYGDPWQLIYVFDGDSTTNVVCEGYAKAFQYLCDLGGLDCISVSGIMSGGTGSGGHMWNVVTLGGRKYLVDVTNCDSGTAGAPDLLFLVGTPYKNGAYSFPCGYQIIRFQCSDLGLSATNYTGEEPPIHEHTYESLVSPPTCKDQGFTTHTCACGEHYEDSYTDPTGIHSFADGACKYCGMIGGSCGEDLWWCFEKKTGTLTISGTGEMDEPRYAPWDSYRDDIKIVIVEDGVTTIGKYAFFNCENLTSITIPDSVNYIGEYAFNRCSSLTDLVIPDSVRSINEYTFFFCSNLGTVTIPSNITFIGTGAFSGCSKLKEIIFKGNAPTISGATFNSTSATAYYPAENTTWNPDTLLDYGGTIRWVSYGEGHIHTEVVTNAVKPTCTSDGKTEGTHCATCWMILVPQKVIPRGHTFRDMVDGICDACGMDRVNVESRKVTHMFRMYNPNTGEHFYTGSEVEKGNLVAVGWQYEGVGFTFPANTGAPVHRLFQPSTGEHLYTMDEAEKASLMADGWNYEGIAFNSAYDTEAVQHRLHNPNATVGAYHFTFSEEEKHNLINVGWEYQGIGWYSCWK